MGWECSFSCCCKWEARGIFGGCCSLQSVPTGFAFIMLFGNYDRTKHFPSETCLKYSQQILWMYNNVACKYTVIALTLQNNLCLCCLVCLSTTLCCFVCFLDVSLQIVENQSFLPFIPEAEQRSSIWREDSVTCIATCFSFTNNAENIAVSQGLGKTGPWSLQQVSEGPALVHLFKILPLFSGWSRTFSFFFPLFSLIPGCF